MPIIKFDPARLITTLNKTGVQESNASLYQLLYQMIGAINKINIDGAAASSLFGNSGLNSESGTNTYSGPVMIVGQDGEDGQDGVPGIRGIDGIVGINGATGVAGPSGDIVTWNSDGDDGYDGFNIPNPGPVGSPGVAGGLGVSLLPIDGEDGEDGFSVLGFAASGVSGSDWDFTIVKQVDQTVATSVQTNDDELFFDVTDGDVWIMELAAVYGSSGTTIDFDFDAVFPTANGEFIRLGIASSDAVSVSATRINSGTSLGILSCGGRSTITAKEVMRLRINMTFFATGTFQVQFSTTAGSGSCAMYAGSFLRARKLYPI